MKKSVVSLLILLASLVSAAQPAPAPPDWVAIERSISQKRNLGDTRNSLLLLKQQALDAGRWLEAGRCYADLLAIADKTTEDTLFFKNALFIDSLLRQPGTAPRLRAVMHLLKARRLSQYQTGIAQRGNRILYHSYDPLYNYASLGMEELKGLIKQQLDTALQLSPSFDDLPPEEWLWLSSDPFTFLFKPRFADLVYAETIDMAQGFFWGGAVEGDPVWLSFSQDAFIQLPDSTTVFTSKGRYVFSLYKQWILFHRSGNPEASYYIESLARKYFYSSLSADSTIKNHYEQYLQMLLQSPWAAVRTHAVYQLCLAWNTDARGYNPSFHRYGGYYDYSYRQQFDSSRRLLYVQALNLYEAHRALLDSFLFIKNVLDEAVANIRAPELSISVYRYHLPLEPIAAQLSYRNTRQLYTRIIKVDSIVPDPDIARKESLVALLQNSFVKEAVQPLPDPGDYQLHTTFVNLGLLPAGRYCILYSDTAFNGDTSRVNYMFVEVTRIAVINNDSRVFVLDRKTGFPLPGATVTYSYGSAGNEDKKTRIRKVNNEGWVTVSEKKVSDMKVAFGDDTVSAEINSPKEHLPESVYDRKEGDGLMDYYADNLRIQLFTDRGIYRPGQTVYFKGIFMIPNPKTGLYTVMNWHNLRVPFYDKLLLKLVDRFSKKKLELYVKDPFNRNIDTLHVMFNSFGSVAGSFVLPKSAATGGWGLYSDQGETESWNQGMFSVENYKRPTFELSIENPKNELALGDSFAVKLLVKSFAGAPLGSVRVKYRIERSGQVPATEVRNSRLTNEVEEQLLTGESYTNDKGELQLLVNDSLLRQYHFTDDRKWVASYTLEAEAIDATGESHSESGTISLSNRPVTLQLSIPEAMDRNELLPLYLNAKSAFAGPVKKEVEWKIYKIPVRGIDVQPREWLPADITLYPEEDLKRLLGDTLPHEPVRAANQLVYEGVATAGGEEKLVLPKDKLTAGYYRLEWLCREHGHITGELEEGLTIYEKATRTLPGETTSFHSLPYNSVEKGKTIRWITGNTKKDVFSIYHLAWYAKTKKGMVVRYAYDIKPEKKGLNEWQYTMPADIAGVMKLTHLYIFNNRLHREEQVVFQPAASQAHPEIIVEQYRRTLIPGGKETFTVSVKTNNVNTAAELMTTLYDASIDKLRTNNWELPRDKNTNYPVNNQWDYTINNKTNNTLFEPKLNDRLLQPPGRLWWMNPVASFNYAFVDDEMGAGPRHLKFPAPDVLNARGLDDVVVIGYGSVQRDSKEMYVHADLVTIRGTASLDTYKELMIVIDGVPYTGDMADINIKTITNGVVLKGADAMALYGNRAAAGVLILSTKGPVQLPDITETPPPVIRKNFTETAFFYPQVYAGRDGYYTISFTLPESVTEWKWKLLAHTRRGAFTYAEKTLYSQLPLMVQPATPRYVYQGDKIILQSRLTNLDSMGLNGQLKCSVEDAETGEDISARLLSTAQQPFSMGGHSTGNGAFTLSIPGDMLHPLRIKITASAGRYSDGEEHIIPVLSSKILVIGNARTVIKDTGLTPIPPPGLAIPGDAEAYGIGIYINPKPQAALINALPSLANCPYDCAEQTFNKLLAYSIAIKIMRSDTAAQKAMQKRKEHADNEPLSGLPDDQSMPWLQLNHATAARQGQLRSLLDTLEAHQKGERYFSDLTGMQNGDGGLPWFKGGKSNAFISGYLLTGFGKLQSEGLLRPFEQAIAYQFPGFIAKLVGYYDKQFSEPGLHDNTIGYLYARSYWINEYPLPAPVKTRLDSLLAITLNNAYTLLPGRQAMLVTATLRYTGKSTSAGQKALQLLESIRQQAITDETNGTRWKSLSDADDLDMQAEEWVAKIAEAFEYAGGRPETVAGIIKWLMQTRQDHDWSSTKATAEIVVLLNGRQPVVTGNPQQFRAIIGPDTVAVTDDLFSGRLFAFRELPGKKFPPGITIQKDSKGAVWTGINFYYFTAHPPQDNGMEDVTIAKALSRYNRDSNQWEEVSENTALSTGDKIRTVLTIQSPRQLQYVFIDDARAAALEPGKLESGYEYSSQLSYYKSVRDAGFNFFADRIPSGVSTIEYETVVSREGVYHNGPAAMQCMYQPGIRAYSSSLLLTVSHSTGRPTSNRNN